MYIYVSHRVSIPTLLIGTDIRKRARVVIKVLEAFIICSAMFDNCGYMYDICHKVSIPPYNSR